jgi:type VI secretion system protein ImpG
MTTSERLFGYYDRELTFIRQLAMDFKARYPRVAGRLQLDAAAQSADPHVERMIEAFALLTANVQLKVDDDFPELTEALFQVLYPHYLAPIPSMAIVQLGLIPGAADNPNGLTLPAHAELLTPAVENVPCRYRTAGPITLWPVEVVDAKFREPPFAPGLEPPEELRNQVRSYLRLSIKTTGNMTFEAMQLDRLRLFLLGDGQLTVGLREMLLTEVRQVVILPENRRLAPTRLAPVEAIRPVGFEPDDVLLPYPKQSFPGFQLLTEFFAYPGRFAFVDVGGWPAARANGLAGKSAEVVIYFSRPPRDGLVQSVNKSTFVPNCAPIVNLFRKTVEGFKLTHRRTEYLLEPDVHASHGYEIYSVNAVTQTDATTGDAIEYRPFYSFHHGGPQQSGPPYWSAVRTARSRQKVDGSPDLEASVGTDVSLRLMDLSTDPLRPSDLTVTVQTTCLNRDLPSLLREAGEGLQFQLQTAAPVQVRCLRPPTPTMRPPLRKRAFWRLMSHLNLNHLSLADGDQGRAAIQEYLRLYDFADPRTDPQLAAVASQVVEGLIAVRSRRTVQFTGSQTAGGYARGVAIDLELDDEKYAGVGAHLFASVIERFLSLYVSVNSFTQLTARTSRKDAEVWTWPPRAGDQPLI